MPGSRLELVSAVDWLSWESFELPLDFSGTKKTAAFIGILPPGTTQEVLEEQLRTAGEDAVAAEIVSSSPEETYVMILCMRAF